MLALGIDPSSKRIAVSALHDTGAVEHQVFRVPGELRGARRLRYIRILLASQLRQFKEVAVVAVEVPWSNPKGPTGNFVLMSVTGVLMEAAQAAHHGAVVLDMPTQVWKRDSVGTGNATKAQVMEHAFGLGLDVEDQDVADALCMAQAAWVRWQDAVNEEAA